MIEIAAYDPAWPTRAQQLLKRITEALTGLPVPVQTVCDHIGSTAIPGLAAKPILDLQVRVAMLPSMDELAAALSPIGFVPAAGARPDSPGVYSDTPRPDSSASPEKYEKRLFHSPDEAAILHIRRIDSPFAEFVVLFRDWLRPHPHHARQYAERKFELAAQHAADLDYDDYTRAKTEIFDRIEPEMRRWAEQRDEPIESWRRL